MFSAAEGLRAVRPVRSFSPSICIFPFQDTHILIFYPFIHSHYTGTPIRCREFVVSEHSVTRFWDRRPLFSSATQPVCRNCQTLRLLGPCSSVGSLVADIPGRGARSGTCMNRHSDMSCGCSLSVLETRKGLKSAVGLERATCARWLSITKTAS